MEREYKRKVFQPLADKFETEDIKEYFLDMCEEIPDYIFTMPSSTSGKYHNKKQCERFGQLYHIFMFASILEHLLRLEHVKNNIANDIGFSPNDDVGAYTRDLIRCVPVFHDAVKCGWNGSQYTVQNHPMLAYEWVLNTKVANDIEEVDKKLIADMCAAHSGEWNKNRKGEEIMPKPRRYIEELIHECDILASRPDLDYIIPNELKETLKLDKCDDLPDVNSYVLNFGKHKGMTLPQIYEEDPGWIDWAKKELKREPIRSLLKQIG